MDESKLRILSVEFAVQILSLVKYICFYKLFVIEDV